MSQYRSRIRAVLLLFSVLLGCTAGGIAGQEGDATDAGWISLFDGKTLEGWEITQFGGEGPVFVKDGSIILSYGEMLTGITWKGEFPKSNYEIELEAARLQGSDFFVGLTFPVRDSFCSLILGGWGGAVVGLSSIDGMDASENETSTLRGFKRGRRYRIRLRVTDEKIEAWIDGEQIVDLETAGRKIDVRPEVRLSCPLGIASYQTRSALRLIRYRIIR